MQFGPLELQHLQRISDVCPQLIQILCASRLELHGKEGPPRPAETRLIRNVAEPAVELVEHQIFQVAGFAEQDQRPIPRITRISPTISLRRLTIRIASTQRATVAP